MPANAPKVRYFDRIAARITGAAPPPEAAKPIPEVTTLGPRSASTTRADPASGRPAGA